MDCKKAKSAIVGMLGGVVEPGWEQELERHLASCPRCRRTLKTYQEVSKAVKRLETPELTPEAMEACEAALRESLEHPAKLIRPPAIPCQSESASGKVVIFVAFLGLVFAIYLAAGYLSRMKQKPPEEVGEIISRQGKVEISQSPRGPWYEIPQNLRLTSGAFLRTDEDGYLKVASGEGKLQIDSDSLVTLVGPQSAYLALGRAILTHEDGIVETSNGTVLCRGSVLVRASPARLMATCLRGEAELKGKEGSLVLHEGEQAMCVRGKVLEIIRQISPSLATLWLKRFESSPPRNLLWQDSALLPVPPEAVDPPQGLNIRKMSIQILARGAIVMSEIGATIENAGKESWRGKLDPEHLLWPMPLSSVASDEIELAAGEQKTVRCVSIAVMAPFGKDFLVAITPEGWTGQPIGELSLNFAGKAAGGISSALSTTHDIKWESAGEAFGANFTAKELSPFLPVLMRFTFAPGAAEDLLVVQGQGAEPGYGLLACRGCFPSRDMLRNVNKFVVAFDANADFGTVGRAYAHEVAEALTAGLNRGVELAMVAYDGQFKVLPPGMKRFDPIEAERMLAALWLLERDNGSPGAVQLLNALSVGNSRQAIGFLITGKQDEQPGAARDLAPAEPRNGIVPIVLQVGAQQPSELYSEACSRLGGACAVMPGALTAEGATLQLLNNMSWQPLAECKFEGAGGLQTSRLLTKPGAFSNSPILLAVALEPGAKKLSVNLGARAGETSAQQALSMNVEGIDPSYVDRRFQEAIRIRLKELLEEPPGTPRP